MQTGSTVGMSFYTCGKQHFVIMQSESIPSMAVKCKVCMEVGFLARSSVFSLSIFLQNQRQYVHRERKCTLRQMFPPKKDNTTEWQLLESSYTKSGHNTHTGHNGVKI